MGTERTVLGTPVRGSRPQPFSPAVTAADTHNTPRLRSPLHGPTLRLAGAWRDVVAHAGRPCPSRRHCWPHVMSAYPGEDVLSSYLKTRKSAELLLRALSCLHGHGFQFQWLPRARWAPVTWSPCPNANPM